jgi:multidrug efflux pump subunit AcrA (membrane-fusion protein)
MLLLTFLWVPLIAETIAAQEIETSAKISEPSITAENAVLKIVDIRDIAAQTAGLIEDTLVQEGTMVAMEQLIMKIDSTQQTNEVNKTAKELEIAALQAESRVDLKFTERSIEVAEAELIRAQRSNQRRPGVVAESELDQLKLIINRSLAEKEQAEFQIRLRELTRQVKQIDLESNRIKESQCRIKSPMAGMIVEVLKRKGEWVSTSEAVARVIRLDVLKIEIKVPITEVIHGLVNAPAKFYPKIKAPGFKPWYPGRVVFVYPEANAISGEVRIWLEIENPELKLIPGLTGRVEIERSHHESASRYSR